MEKAARNNDEQFSHLSESSMQNCIAFTVGNNVIFNLVELQSVLEFS